MDWDASSSQPSSCCSGSGYWLLLQALSLIPISHYLIGSAFVFIFFLYNFMEFHFLQDLFSFRLRGSPVELTYNPCSQIYEGVVSKCEILHGTYLPTPWLSSPHLQTCFLNFFGRPPVFSYKRSAHHHFSHFLIIKLTPRNPLFETLLSS